MPKYKYYPGNIFFEIDKENPNVSIYANNGSSKENMTKLDFSFGKEVKTTSDENFVIVVAPKKDNYNTTF